MNDSNDGSSSAAQGAQHDRAESDLPGDSSGAEKSDASPGFFGRLFGAFSAGEESDGDTDPDGPGHAPNHSAALDPRLGLGNLRRLSVEDVAIPKADIVSVPATVTKEELYETFRDSGLTRLPVYEGTLDTPIGFAHLKDFALKHGFNGASSRFSLKRLLRPLMFVPPSMTIGVLLQKMQAERRHMALVIDEYGGVDGLVTIEDLIEQVVGEIADEHDQEDDSYWSIDQAGCYIVQAKAPLEEFEAEIGLSLTESEDIDEEEIDTLGGLVFMLLGRVPARGELVEHPSGIEIQILDSDPRRIKRLRVRLPEALAKVAEAE